MSRLFFPALKHRSVFVLSLSGRFSSTSPTEAGLRQTDVATSGAEDKKSLDSGVEQRLPPIIHPPQDHV